MGTSVSPCLGAVRGANDGGSEHECDGNERQAHQPLPARQGLALYGIFCQLKFQPSVLEPPEVCPISCRLDEVNCVSNDGVIAERANQ
jgi:hypothetical protein